MRRERTREQPSVVQPDEEREDQRAAFCCSTRHEEREDQRAAFCCSTRHEEREDQRAAFCCQNTTTSSGVLVSLSVGVPECWCPGVLVSLSAVALT
ncbi:hypothetical protein ACOMHN_000106 [Nucella lapillus]